ncbi:MAG: serine hydrolase [Solirubrobacteraceae bacterium]
MSPASAGLGIALVLAVASLAAGCGGASAPAKVAARAESLVRTLAPVTATPASKQLDWVIGELNRGASPTAADLAAHFSSAFLAAVPPKQLIADLTPFARQDLVIVGLFGGASADALAAEVNGTGGSSFRVTITVSPTTSHLIEGLLLSPLPRAISSWSGVDRALERLAPQASLYAGYAGGGQIHALNGTEAGAIGSAFKLYVLGALGAAVEHGSVRWNTPLAIRNAWRSLPSGNMWLEPAGRKFTLLHYATQMISVSDNTAADHLIGLLGRAAVEAQLTALANHSIARNEPFLTTRELFALKLAAPRSLTDAFAAGDTAERVRLLPRIDSLTPTIAEAASWTTPRSIDKIEWFASPADLAHAIAELEVESGRPGLSPIRQILAINPGIGFNRAVWPYVGYKGGSEPGVLSTTWYLRRRDGRTFVLSIVLNNPKANISTLAEVSVAEAAVNLLTDS